MCSSVQRNSTAALKNKKPITHRSPARPLHELLPVHPLIITVPPTAPNGLMHTHSTHDSCGPLHKPHMHTSLLPLPTPTLSPDHSMSYIRTLCAPTHSPHISLSPTACTTWTDAHTTHVVLFLKYKMQSQTPTHPLSTPLHMHTLTSTLPSGYALPPTSGRPTTSDVQQWTCAVVHFVHVLSVLPHCPTDLSVVPRREK